MKLVADPGIVDVVSLLMNDMTMLMDMSTEIGIRAILYLEKM